MSIITSKLSFRGKNNTVWGKHQKTISRQVSLVQRLNLSQKKRESTVRSQNSGIYKNILTETEKQEHHLNSWPLKNWSVFCERSSFSVRKMDQTQVAMQKKPCFSSLCASKGFQKKNTQPELVLFLELRIMKKKVLHPRKKQFCFFNGKFSQPCALSFCYLLQVQ